MNTHVHACASKYTHIHPPTHTHTHTFLTLAYKKAAQSSVKYITYIIHRNSRENDRYHLHLNDKKTNIVINIVIRPKVYNFTNTGANPKSLCILNPHSTLKG